MNKKHIIVSFVVGILVAVFAYQVYVNHQLSSNLNSFATMYQSDHDTLAQIVTLINNSKAPTK